MLRLCGLLYGLSTGSRLSVRNGAMLRSSLLAFSRAACSVPQNSGSVFRTHLCGELDARHVGSKVRVWGWVASVRPRGKSIAFMDVRDHSGEVQLIFDSPSAREQALSVSNESVVHVDGTVNMRPGGSRTQDKTGMVEVLVDSIRVLSPCIEMPQEYVLALNKLRDKGAAKISSAGELGDVARLKHRVLDLRTARMQRNIRTRARVNSLCRAHMEKHEFVEVETPTLFRPSPEGAREFLVPCSSQKRSFYALPQSPQQYKQLLMAAGMDKYYQIARCYRDEKLRADRQPEFTQLDLEMSCVTPRHVHEVIEGLLVTLFKEIRGIEVSVPFPYMEYSEAMRRFGIDKPDMRFGNELQDLSGISEDECMNAVHWTSFGALEHEDVLNIVREVEQKISITSAGKDTSFAVGFGAGRVEWIGDRAVANVSAQVNEKLNVREGDVVAWCSGGNERLVQTVMGTVRLMLRDMATRNGTLVLDDDHLCFLWVYDFPLFEVPNVEDTAPIGVEGRALSPVHHPFTAPVEEDVSIVREAIETGDHSRLLDVRGQHYDCVLNGVELGGGSIRIHESSLQRAVFTDILKYAKDVGEGAFPHLLGAFDAGCPPHGGIALGLDRLVAILCGEQNIRNVIAFPKAGSGRELMTESPTTVNSDELSAQLGLVYAPE